MLLCVALSLGLVEGKVIRRGFLAVSSLSLDGALHRNPNDSWRQLRGGAAGQSRWSASPLGIKRDGSQRKQYPIVEDLSDEQDTKEMINAFLSRDSRNTFIGG